MDKIVDFIHVGDYKTGTSWLQETVFPMHPEIQYLGDHFSNEKLQLVLRELVDIRDLDYNPEKLKKKFLENYNKIPGKISGISREALSQADYISGEHAKRNAQRIKDVFGNVKIIYVIREQISMLGSIYSQYVKIGGTRSFEDWFLDPLECKGIIDRLKYDKNIQMYYDIFGRENVLVLLFEELREDKKEFLEKIYSFIGCKDINFIPKESEKAVNTSLTTHGAAVARFLHRFVRNYYHNLGNTVLGLDKIIYRFGPKKLVENRRLKSEQWFVPNYGKIDEKQRTLASINMALARNIEMVAGKIKTGKKLKVPDTTAQQIKPLFKESNSILKEKYGLKVDKYGWSL